MPEGTRVDRLYKKLLAEGKSKGSAARIAQSATRQSLKTGRKPKHHHKGRKSRVKRMSQHRHA